MRKQRKSWETAITTRKYLDLIRVCTGITRRKQPERKAYSIQIFVFSVLNKRINSLYELNTSLWVDYAMRAYFYVGASYCLLGPFPILWGFMEKRDPILARWVNFNPKNVGMKLFDQSKELRGERYYLQKKLPKSFTFL